MFECLACSVAQLGNDVPIFSCLSAYMVQCAHYQETEGPMHVCVSVAGCLLLLLRTDCSVFWYYVFHFGVLRYLFFMKLWWGQTIVQHAAAAAAKSLHGSFWKKYSYLAREKNWETAAKCNFFWLKNSFKKHLSETPSKGFRGGPVVKHLPANAGGTGLMPGWEDPTCCRATKPVCHKRWACALEPGSHSKRRQRNGKPTHYN